MWEPQFAPFAERYHVLAPQLIGPGGSLGDAPFTLSAAAAAVAALVRTHGALPVHLCGLSLGAMVALQVYQQDPDIVASLALSGGQVHPNPLLMGVQRVIMAAIPERQFTDSMPTFFKERYPTLVEVAQAEGKRIGKRGIIQVTHEVGRADYRRLLPNITVPTLVMCGSRDRVNLPASKYMKTRVPQASLYVVPDAGHEWNLEQPDVFTQTLLTFWQARTV
jgi:3-oxoadipate enol-lactonase